MSAVGRAWQATGSSRGIGISLGLLVLGIVVVAQLSPADAVLGGLVRLVYVHAAVVEVAMLAFAVAGGLGAIYLVKSRDGLADWSQACFRTAIFLWAVYLITSAIVTIKAWGGMAWFEPRWIFGFRMAALAPAAEILSWLMKRRRVTAGVNAAVLGLMVWLLSRASLVLHPRNPIGEARTENIKVYFAAITLLTLLAGLQLVRGAWLLGRRYPLWAGEGPSQARG